MTDIAVTNDAMPAAIVAAIESKARRVETPCGDGVMVWRIWGETHSGLAHPLLLLHGGSGSWKHWLRNIEHFARSRAVIAPDMPGYGDSAEPPQPLSFASLGAIMGAGLDSILKPGAAYDIMGFSLGSFMAPWLIKASKARAVSLTLVHGHLVGVMHYSPQNRLKRWRGVEDRAERDAILRNNLGALMLAHPESADELTLHVYRNDLDQARLRVPGFIDTLDTSVLSDLRVKLFAISGDQDPTASPNAAAQHELLRALRPDVQTHIINGAGHWVMWEAVEKFQNIADLNLDQTLLS